tara:strand:+ start:519 stop:1406 length:888 start_codon:yes stop_codon:yes gene_type:complete
MKKSKFNRFFKIATCVIISFSFWTLNKLSKKSKNNISIKVNIIDLPENIALDSVSSKQINLKVSGVGSLKTRKEEINISANNISNQMLHIKKEEVESQLESNIKVVDIYPDTIYLYTSKKEIKKVPVKHNIIINLNENHWLKNKIKIEPDSIVIKGNKRELEKINFLETKKLTLLNVSGEKKGKILLKENKFLEKEMELNYKLETEKFTEGRLNIQIEAINYPRNKEVLLFPNTILLKYLVSEKNYNKIRKEDFKIICDFKNIDISEKFCTISIIKKPKDVKILHKNKKIEFLIQ